MRPLHRLRLNQKLLLLVGDIAVFFIALAVSSVVRDPTPLSAATFLTFAPVLAIFLTATYSAGLYELRIVRDFVELIGGLLATALAVWLLSLAYFYFVSLFVGSSPKTTLFLTIVLAQFGVLVWRRIVLAATRFSVLDLTIKLLTDDVYRQQLRRLSLQHFDETLHLADESREKAHLVVIDRRWSVNNASTAREAIGDAIMAGVPIVGLDEFHEALFGKVSPHQAADLSWALDHVLPRAGSLYFKVKRFSDVFVAASLLCLLLPILGIVTLLIWVVDQAPPFYSQIRIGYLGKTFLLWKFRTMQLSADSEGPFSQPVGVADHRVTKVGRLLRSTRIDELPQLWNVIRGEMSLVGPRPEWIEEAQILEKTIPTYSLRYLVPPGITGWAQVRYRSTNNPTDSVEKHHFDLYYLKHFSLALDCTIILKTIKRVFTQDSEITTLHVPQSGSGPLDLPVDVDVASIVRRK